MTERIRNYDLDCEYTRRWRGYMAAEWQRYVRWWDSRMGDRRRRHEPRGAGRGAGGAGEAGWLTALATFLAWEQRRTRW